MSVAFGNNKSILIVGNTGGEIADLNALQINNNLSDVEDATEARVNLNAAALVETFFNIPDGSTITIDWNNGAKHKCTLEGNREIAYANIPDGGRVQIDLIQDVGGNKTVTWPTTTWDGGSAPTLPTASNKRCSIIIYRDDTVYYGGMALANL